jgi:Domain of unknown function (DUF4157)
MHARMNDNHQTEHGVRIAGQLFSVSDETRKRLPMLMPSVSLSNRALLQQLPCQWQMGNQAGRRPPYSRGIQAKLKISQPWDKYEQEADQVTETVMRSAGIVDTGISDSPRNIARKCTACSSGHGLCPKCAAHEEIQRKPLDSSITSLIHHQSEEPEFEEDKEEILQVEEILGHSPGVNPGIEDRLDDMRSGGQPLSESARAFFEPRFGHDFSQVRLHSDREAQLTAAAIGAKAFTCGTHIWFGSGRGPNDERLLAHELVHTLQQTKGQTSTLRGLEGDRHVRDSLEREASDPSNLGTVKGTNYLRNGSQALRASHSPCTASQTVIQLNPEDDILRDLKRMPSAEVEGLSEEEQRRRREELDARRQRLRNAFEAVPYSEAEALYQRLVVRKRGDTLSERFHDILATDTREEMLNILLVKLFPEVLPEEEITKEEEAKEDTTQETTTTLPPENVKRKCGELEDAEFVVTRKINDMLEVRGYHKGLCCAYFGLRGFLGKWPKQRPLYGSSYTWEVKALGGEGRLIIMHPPCQWGLLGSIKITVLEVKGCYRLLHLLLNSGKYPDVLNMLGKSDPQICLVGNITVDITRAQSKDKIIRATGAVSARIDLDVKIPSSKFKLTGRLDMQLPIGFIELGMDPSGKVSTSGELEWSWPDIDNLFINLPSHISLEVANEPEPVLPPETSAPPKLPLPIPDLPRPWWETMR